MKISENIKYIGVNDHKIDLFEGQYSVPNGISYNSYVVLDEKIAVFDTVGNEYRAVERLAVVHIGKRSKLFNKRRALFFGYEFRCAHRVDQKLQFGELEFAFGNVIANAFSAHGAHVEPKLFKRFEVVVNAFSLGGYPVGGERAYYLLHRKGVRFVAPFEQNTAQYR